MQETVQYFAHTVSGVSIYPEATDTIYRDTAGTVSETTSYAYTWFSGTA